MTIETFWNVNIYGFTFQVDNDTAGTMRADMASQEPSPSTTSVLQEYEDIYGSRIFLDIRGINSMWQSSPEWRTNSRQHDKFLKAERPDFDE